MTTLTPLKFGWRQQRLAAAEMLNAVCEPLLPPYDSPLPANSCEYLRKPYIARNQSHLCC